jgi:hypothetical protein
MRGTLGGGKKIREQFVSVTSGQRLFGRLGIFCYWSTRSDRSLLNDLTRAVPKAFVQANAEEAKPLGLIKLVITFWTNNDSRRGLAAFNDFLEIFGKT